MGKRKIPFQNSPTPDVIQCARRGLAMTQEEAAALAMVSQSTWAGWESGVRPMHPWIWAKWVELAPAEGKRLRPYYFVNPSEVQHIPQMPVASVAPPPLAPAAPSGTSIAAVAGTLNPERARDLASRMDKYGLTDADCIKAIRGITREAWELMKQGYSMQMSSYDTVGALERFGEARKAMLEKPIASGEEM